MNPGEKGNQFDDQIAGFAKTLARLKQEGSNLLVVGPPLSEIHQQICTQMAGESAIARRERIVVLVGDTQYSAVHMFQTSTHPLTFIRHPTPSRSTVAYKSIDSTNITELQSSSEQLGCLKDCIFDAISRFENNTSPGELRVCFDSLLPLIEDYETDETIEFLQSVTDQIHSVRGMGHFHLPVSTEREIIDQLQPSFDAVVELRITEEGAQQRWYLYDTEEMLEWLPI